jgi:hypothetical protein
MSNPNGIPIERCLFNGCLKYDELAPDELIHSISWKKVTPATEYVHKRKTD